MAVEQLKAEILTWQSALSAHDAGNFRTSLHLFEPIADTAKIFVNVALIHDRLGERALAIENISRAIELDKYLAIGYLQRGVYFFHGGQYAEALQDFSEAQAMMRTNLEIDYDMLGLPYKLKLQEILFNKLLALLRLENKKEGLVVLQTIIAGSPPPDLAAKVLRTEHSVADAEPVSLVRGARRSLTHFDFIHCIA
ncbi:hypothetical protein DFH08DRAFT_723721 [Mycena albidolilacea]|uniref:Uncharacterized protein n=1 Tax=Mycena albidolilacea TaxID=1033008 RepID=A0AAD7E7N2_9AGAR|nr:hypothetical protein DFH08DRAFT_723721 [Mycena albidolilacea]